MHNVGWKRDGHVEGWWILQGEGWPCRGMVDTSGGGMAM